ncbi:MAG: hypothetical protein Q4B34_01270, partial [Candidatus Saccharibacteria bacterium]|nr:hypothetical protein [Candidatus Saccharibacteria bacterium]
RERESNSVTPEGEARQMKMVYEALGLWALNNESYRNTPKLYWMLYQKKIDLKIPVRRGDKIKKLDLDQYPEIPVLREKNEEVAFEILSGMSLQELSSTMRQIEQFKEHFVYRTMLARISDFRFQIDRHGKPKPKYAYDPEYRGSSGGNSRGRSRRSGLSDE